MAGPGMPAHRPNRAGPGSRALAAGTALATCLTLVAAAPAVAAASHFLPHPLPKMRSVPGHALRARRPGPDPAAQRALHGRASAAAFPAGGAATISLGAAGGP